MKSKLTPFILSSLLLAGWLTRAQAAEAKYDEMPVPVKSVAPAYPADMLKEGASGIVTLLVVIDEHGDVLERSVSKSTRAEFETAAIDAVEKWKFKPAKKDGVAVKARITIPIKFTAGA